MMAAMMLPSAVPMIRTFTAVQRSRGAGAPVRRMSGLFTLGYVVAWAGFSLAATLVQWGLAEAALLSPMTQATGTRLGGAILVAAGLFQWTPLKHACLRRCRTPLGFILTEWREGWHGAWVMGLRHGRYCIGCCWALMALLFAVGVMNLLWIAVLTAFILVEKIVPYGPNLTRAAGAALTAAGLWLVIAGA